MKKEKLWQIKKLALATDMSESFWRKRIADGSVGAIRIGKRSIRVPGSQVDKLLRERGETKAATSVVVEFLPVFEGGQS